MHAQYSEACSIFVLRNSATLQLGAIACIALHAAITLMLLLNVRLQCHTVERMCHSQQRDTNYLTAMYVHAQ
jgi:hypothetical protein